MGESPRSQPAGDGNTALGPSVLPRGARSASLIHAFLGEKLKAPLRLEAGVDV